jgi:hypothetical protein
MNHRIDARATIVERVEPADVGDPGLDIDVVDADIGAKRIGHVWRVVITDLRPGLHPRRDIVVSGEGEFGHRP